MCEDEEPCGCIECGEPCPEYLLDDAGVERCISCNGKVLFLQELIDEIIRLRRELEDERDFKVF